MGIRWYDQVKNASIIIRTGQPPLTTIIPKLRLGAFGHICRLQPGTQAIHIMDATPTFIMAPPKRTPTTPLGRPDHQGYPDVPE